MMKFYISSSFSNKEAVREAANQLKKEGFVHVYDWTLNSFATSPEELTRIGEEEKQAVMKADFFILLLPGGRGSHVELGIALAAGKRVYIYSPENETNFITFYHVRNVHRCTGDLYSFIQFVVQNERIYHYNTEKGNG